MTNNRVVIYSLIVLSMIIWAFSYIWVKQIYVFYSPLTTIFFRVFIAAIFLFLLCLSLRKIQVPAKSDWPKFFLLALFDPCGYFLFEGLGLNYSPPTVSAVIISTIPLLLPIAGFFALKEKLTRLNIAGMILSFIGVLLVVVKGDLSLAASPVGLTFLFFAVACSIASNLVLKKLTLGYNVYSIIFWLNVLSSIYLLPFFVAFDFSDFYSKGFVNEILFPLIAVSVLASALAFLFYIKGIKEIGASKTNIFVNVIPVFTAIFSYFILNEILSMQMIAGIVVVIAGLLLSQVRSRAVN